MKENTFVNALKSQINDMSHESSLNIQHIHRKLDFLDMISRNQNHYYETLKHTLETYTNRNVENIRTQYQLSESLSKSLIQIESDQTKHLSAISQTREQMTKHISKRFHTTTKAFEVEIQKMKAELDAPLKSLKLNFNRAKNDIDKQIIKITDDYENEVKFVLQLKRDKLSQNEEKYLEKIKNFESQYRDYLNQQTILLNQITKDRQKQKSANDVNYLSIKKTHHLQNEHTNLLINQRKKELLTIKSQLEAKLVKELNIIEETYDDIISIHSKRVFEEHNRYEQKLNALNVIFDVQKSNFNQSKQKLTKQNADAITLLNSKLSAAKENIHIEKKALKKQLFSQLKHASDIEKKQIELEYNQQLKHLDLSLEKQIKRTSKDVIGYEKAYQKDLFMLESSHVHQVNNWRISHAVYEYEHKLYIQSLEQKLDLINQTKARDTDHAKQNHKHLNQLLDLQTSIDLLPLETQIHISSAIQEREINLLSNETQTYTEEKTLDEYVIKSMAELERLKHEYLKHALELEYSHVEKKTTIEAQLDQELSKIKKETLLSIQNQKLEIEQYNVDRGQILKTHQNHLYDSTLDYLRDYHKVVATKQIESLRFNLGIATLAHNHYLIESKQSEQTEKNISKINTSMNSYLYELDKNKHNVYSFYHNIFSYFGNILKINDLLDYYFKAPVTPEVLNSLSKAFSQFLIAYQSDLLNLVSHYESHILQSLDEKIENFSGYKYMLKHEDILSDFTAKESILISELDRNEKQIIKYRYQLNNLKNNIEKLNGIIDGHKQHKKDIAHITSIRNYRQGIKNAKKQIKRNDSDLANALKNQILLKRALETLRQDLKSQETLLDQDKQSELKDVYIFKTMIQTLSKNLRRLIADTQTQVITFLQTISNPVNIYLTESKFDAYSSQFITIMNKKLRFFQKNYERYLNYHYTFYKHFNDAQVNLKFNIEGASKNLSKKLLNDYESDIDQHTHQYEQRIYDLNIQLKNIDLKYEQLKRDSLTQYQMSKQSIDHSLLACEEKISFFENDLNYRQSLIKSNLNDVVTELDRTLVKSLNAVKYTYESNTSKLEKQIKHKKHMFNENKESNERKHRALLDRYESTYLKLISNKMRKTKELNLQMNRINTAHNRLIRLNNEALSNQENAHKSFILAHDKKIKLFEIQTTYRQKSVTRKELRTLRKSYLFKINELKLK